MSGGIGVTRRTNALLTAVITACVVLIATGAVTNFFSPDELELVKAHFWALPLTSRSLLVLAVLGVPILAIQGGRLVWHTFKGLVGWEYPPDRSGWFVTSRFGALALIIAMTWWLSESLLAIASTLVA